MFPFKKQAEVLVSGTYRWKWEHVAAIRLQDSARILVEENVVCAHGTEQRGVEVVRDKVPETGVSADVVQHRGTFAHIAFLEECLEAARFLFLFAGQSGRVQRRQTCPASRVVEPRFVHLRNAPTVPHGSDCGLEESTQ